MALNNILSVFLPKDKVFYSLFEQTAQNVTEMGKLLHQYVFESDANNRLTISKQIEDLEHKNDEITHLEASDNYTMIYLANGSRHLSSKNIKVYEDNLNANIFYRRDYFFKMIYVQIQIFMI